MSGGGGVTSFEVKVWVFRTPRLTFIAAEILATRHSTPTCLLVTISAAIKVVGSTSRRNTWEGFPQFLVTLDTLWQSMGDEITLGPWTLWIECGCEELDESAAKITIGGENRTGKGSRPLRSESAPSSEPHDLFL